MSWNSGLFDCLDSEPVVCLLGTFLPCVLFGRNAQGGDGINGDCCAFCLTGFLGCQCFVHMPVRKEISPVDESVGEACLKTWCCCCCALIQESKQLGSGGGMLGAQGRAPRTIPGMGSSGARKGKNRSRGGSGAASDSSSSGSGSYGSDSYSY